MNTFGSSTLQFALCDVKSVLADRNRFRREAIPLLDRANSFYCPVGCWSFKGYVLLPRSEYTQLSSYSTTLQLNIGDTRKANNVSTFKNLCISQAQCVTRGLASDPDALYLIEITDGRGILANHWFRFPLNASYNIRAPAYPDTFHPSSMNGGTTWTWSTMIGNIWTQMATFLGSYPGLPSTPSGTPEGFWFTGVPAWYTLCDILEHLGMTIACNLSLSSPYTIVSQNATDTAYTTLLNTYTPNLEDDLEWIDTGAARVPATVKVLFRRRNSTYGTEESVRYDSLQWDMTPVYTVSVSAPAAFSSAVGTHYIWSDFTVRYDQDGSPVTVDTTTASTIASERVTQYYSCVNAGNHTTRTYTGALPFVTGSQVDGVKHYMDVDGDGGWRTCVVYGIDPPWPNLWSRYQ